MGQGLEVNQLVDPHDLDLRLPLQQRAKCLTADPPEPVDGYAHVVPSRAAPDRVPSIGAGY